MRSSDEGAHRPPRSWGSVVSDLDCEMARGMSGRVDCANSSDNIIARYDSCQLVRDGTVIAFGSRRKVLPVLRQARYDVVRHPEAPFRLMTLISNSPTL